MALRRRCTLHLVRHAESNWNVLTAHEHVGAHPGLIDVDSDLSPTGEQQLEALRKGPALTPPLELILASPLRRALRTAVALQESNGGATKVPIYVDTRATEWLENSCDCGRPGSIIQREFGSHVRGLQDLGDVWWPQLSNEDTNGPRSKTSTLAGLASGGREPVANVDRRCLQLLHRLLHELPQSSIAVVAHCMVLHRLETMLRELRHERSGARTDVFSTSVDNRVEYLANTEVRSIVTS